MKLKSTAVLEPNHGHRVGRFLIDCVWWLMAFVWAYLGSTALLAIVLEGAMAADVALGGLFFRPLLLLETIMVLPVLLPLALVGALGHSVGRPASSASIPLVCRVFIRSFGLLFLLSIIFGWVHYSYTGRFPSVDACSFYLKSPVHLVEHALQFSPLGLLVLSVASVCLYLILIIGTPIVMGRFSVRLRAILGGFGVLLFVLFLFLNAILAKSR